MGPEAIRLPASPLLWTQLLAGFLTKDMLDIIISRKTGVIQENHVPEEADHNAKVSIRNRKPPAALGCLPSLDDVLPPGNIVRASAFKNKNSPRVPPLSHPRSEYVR